MPEDTRTRRSHALPAGGQRVWRGSLVLVFCFCTAEEQPSTLTCTKQVQPTSTAGRLGLPQSPDPWLRVPHAGRAYTRGGNALSGNSQNSLGEPVLTHTVPSNSRVLDVESLGWAICLFMPSANTREDLRITEHRVLE